ncbi:MAG: pyruvate formate lyase family protein [Promethearchaeota archaeon]|jgi:formate C-acetyltransferase
MILDSSRRRTVRLKENLLSSKYELCFERSRFFTEIYREFPDNPEIIKRAKAIAHTLTNMTIFIREDESLVGNETSKNLGEKINLDLFSYDGTLNKRSGIKKYSRRKVQPFFMDENDITKFLELIPFWKGKALYSDIISQRILDEKLVMGKERIATAAPNIAIVNGTNEGHICAGYEKLLKRGYKGIIKEAESYQLKLQTEDLDYEEKFNFYEAIKILYTAAIDFSKRYSELAYKKALDEINDQRRKELETIGKMMEKFTKSPPESFYEAIQLINFTQNIINIIYQRSVVALGRLDQILWPFYKDDMVKNNITKEFALELIEELNLKLTWNVTLLPTDYTSIANALGQNTQTITISGIDQEGNDATNEISYLFLEAYKNIKAFTTDLSIRVHNKTPPAFLKEAIKVFRSTSGIAFYNDEIIVPAMIKGGYTIHDARNYAIIGCVEPTSQGNTFAATGRMFINLPGVLELTLYNGYCNLTQQIGGLETGDPRNFSTYEEFYVAFIRQLRYNLEKTVKIADIGDEETIKHFPQPFVSAIIDGCMEKGKDYTEGGAQYNFSSITAYGFATLVDSMFNIKKLVYDEKIITLPKLIEILNSNFSEHEELRQQLLNKHTKWGNDMNEIDLFAKELWYLFCTEVVKHKCLRGGRYNPGAYSMGIHVIEGLFTKASADGRKANQALSNSLSPVNKKEKNGLTAVLNSIAKLNYGLAVNGVAVNVRINPQNLETEENIEKFNHLLTGYFNSGGMQLQPTVVSTETLRDAQQHPDEYQDLVVKVGGYNATFVDLGTPIQNDIIDRLEHSL